MKFKMIMKLMKSSIPSILGLSISLSMSFLIFWLLAFELNFDADQIRKDQIYRITMAIKSGDSEDHYATSGLLLGQRLMEKYPAIETYVSFGELEREGIIAYNNRFFAEEKIVTATSDVFDIFSFSVIEGNEKEVLENKNAAVLTRSLAEKVFGTTKAINEVFSIDEVSYVVSSIIEDIPNNSSLQFDLLIPNTIEIPEEEVLQSFFNLDHYTYVLINEANGDNDLKTSINNYGEEVFNPILEQVGAGIQVAFYSTSLEKLHLSDRLLLDIPKGNRNNLYILLGLAILLIIIGVSNFLNLNMIRLFKSVKKVGILRTFGVNMKNIKLQFISESVGVVVVSSIASIFLTYIIIINVEAFDIFRYTPNVSQVFLFVALVLGIPILVGIIAGLIPTNQMSKMDISSLLKDEKSFISHNSWNQRVILFVQIFLSLGLMIGAIELYRQFTFFQNQQLGFDSQNVIVVKVPDAEKNAQNMQLFKQKLLTYEAVDQVSLCQIAPGEELWQELFGINVGGEVQEAVQNLMKVDEDYFEVLDISLQEGRNFDRVSDNKSVIVNEAFLKKYPETKVGETKLRIWDTHPVVGVIKDYHHLSFHNPIEPLIITRLDESSAPLEVIIRTDIENFELIESTWDDLGIQRPLDYYFLDTHFSEQYAREMKLLWILTTSSLFAIALCCFGLYSMITITIKNRRRELAIRRVLGSTFGNGFFLLFRPYLIISACSVLLIIPPAFYLINRWKENYAYSSGQSVATYMLPMIVMGMVLVATVYFLLKGFSKKKVAELIAEE